MMKNILLMALCASSCGAMNFGQPQPVPNRRAQQPIPQELALAMLAANAALGRNNPELQVGAKTKKQLHKQDQKKDRILKNQKFPKPKIDKIYQPRK